jgi:hypothetical protein
MLHETSGAHAPAAGQFNVSITSSCSSAEEKRASQTEEGNHRPPRLPGSCRTLIHHATLNNAGCIPTFGRQFFAAF